MARPSKLSPEQCDRIRMLKEEGVSAPKLAKRFKLSESSVYKILNGSYIAGPAGSHKLPPLVETENKGATPSLFTKGRMPTSEEPAQEQQASSRVIQAAEGSRNQPVDEVTLAAAELIVARAKYEQARKHIE